MTDGTGSARGTAGRIPAHSPQPLIPGVSIRLLDGGDAESLAQAYGRNRRFLAPWEPKRDDTFFTPAHQLDIIRAKRGHYELGTEVPWVLVAEDDGGTATSGPGGDGTRIAGTITLTAIVRGPFLSANLGYWVDQDLNGRGIGAAAVHFAVGYAQRELGLHRVQAATLLHNTASRRILQRSGFREIGVASEYLKIAGTWQDHLLHQLILPQGSVTEHDDDGGAAPRAKCYVFGE
jgi:[ribosomal protein S5]-alanine N-acetyltransferase